MAYCFASSIQGFARVWKTMAKVTYKDEMGGSRLGELRNLSILFIGMIEGNLGFQKCFIFFYQNYI